MGPGFRRDCGWETDYSRGRAELRGNTMPGKVGFIGLGAMGGPMALNLIEASFSLVVHDIDPAKLAPLAAQGAAVEHTPAAAAAPVEPPICMVQTAHQAHEVITADHGS